MIEHPLTTVSPEQVNQNQAEQQATESHAPGISHGHNNLPQQNRSIGYAAGQQGFQCMSLTLPGDGIANKANDDRKWNPENHEQLDRRECQPLKSELQWEVDAHYTDQEQGAYHCLPPALEEQ